MALRPTIYSSISRAIGSTVLGGGFSGLLDQYPGASAAYSLRALSAGWLAGDVVEVRRSSDSTSQDFTASQITSGAMLDFVNHDTTDLYNSARWFNGVDTQVDLDSEIEMAGDFSISMTHLYVPSGASQQILSKTGSADDRFGYSSGSNAYYFSTSSGADIFAGSAPIEGINTITLIRVGSTVTLTLNGSDYTTTEGGIFTVSRIGTLGNSTSSAVNGSVFSININNQAAYTGLGTSVTAWEDTIGSNDGTETNGAAYTGQPYDGFVSTWYDQSGNGYDATQATTTAQPKIVDAGVLVADGIDFDGVDDQLMVIGNPVITADFSGTFSTFSVQAVASAEGGHLFGCASASGGTSQYATSASRYTTSSGTSTALDRIFRASDSNLLSSVYDSGNAGLLVNGGGTMTDQGVYNFAAGTVDFTIGNRSGGSSSLTFMNGKVNEIIVYNSNQSINRSDIESEIMTNYGL